MNLGVLLPLGDSLASYKEHGQDVRFVKYYLKKYCQDFKKVYLFSYKREYYRNLPKNCVLVSPPFALHRYFYGLLLPILKIEEFRQCDVFRCSHPSAAVPAIIGKFLFSKKFIFNYNYDYTTWAKIEKRSYLVPWIKINQWLAFRLCDGVFVADEKIAKYCQKYVEARKITLVRNGVDTNLFRLAKPTHQDKIILSVGRLEPQKNFKQLVGAISGFQEKVKLVIVGRGQQRQELIDLANQRNVNLKIINVVPHDQLPKIYQSANVYVQPSLMEAPVKTLLEAMACGLPCVASDVPGIRDVIADGQNGLLAKLDPKDIALKISTVLQNKSLATKLGKSARKLIIEKYNLSKILAIETDKLIHV